MTKTTDARGRVRVEPGSKRIRAYLGGEIIADAARPLLVWEKPYYPTYSFPAADGTLTFCATTALSSTSTAQKSCAT